MEPDQSDPSINRQENLNLFFPNGKTVILPIDHAVAIATPGLEDPIALIEQTLPFVDGYVVNLGIALRVGPILENKGVCLRTDVYNIRAEGEGAGTISIYGIEEAEMVGANAVMNMLFPGGPNERLNFQECADLIRVSLDSDVAVILEALPRGLGQPNAYTAQAVTFAARLAAELGADAVKVPYPTNGSIDDFKRIVDSTFIPVVILGGAAMNDDAGLLKMVEDAMTAGAAGIAVGRNVWQHSNPAAMARSLHAVVHHDLSALEALALLKEPIR